MNELQPEIDNIWKAQTDILQEPLGVQRLLWKCWLNDLQNINILHLHTDLMLSILLSNYELYKG
jgi:hypothetical protein